MIIYLLRHAIAVPRGTPGFPNDDRPLTEEGREKMIDVAKGIAKIVDGVDLIISSPLTRALETAKIAAASLQYKSKIEISNELLPVNPASNVITYLSNHASLDKIMLVGHEPQMGHIASYLLGSKEGIIEIKKGSLCCIEINTLPFHNPGILLWHLRPGQLRKIG